MGAIGDALVAIGVRAEDDQYRVVCLAAEFSESVEWAAAGFSSPGRCIAHQLDVTKRTANDWIRIGMALRSLPIVSAALEMHEISLTKAKVLTRTANPETEAELLELAQRVTVSLDDGTPLTHSVVAKLLPEAFVRALIHDADGRPINASGRQRHPTVRQQRVVKERDRVCMDCGERDLLQYDHVPDFEISKRTVVDELELRCSTCHRFRHRSGAPAQRRPVK